MYLKRLIIKNFRSIKFLDVQFTKGKNVIIGRNNAGKSNIIKAIDIVLGEREPTYPKLENITESDFYSWKEQKNNGIEVNASDELMIYCELIKDKNEDFDWEIIKNTYGSYYWVTSPKFRNFWVLIRKNFGENSKNKKYLKSSRDMEKLKQFLNFSRKLVYIFMARKDHNWLHKNMYLSFKIGRHWIVFKRPFIRTELLQSAIIPSFRDPSSQLRLTQWSWYGKLMKYLVNEKKKGKEEELRAAFDEVRKISNEIFEDVKKEILSSSLKVAFPGAEIFFQFIEDKNQDIYKNVVIHIDDGVKSNLQDKGSGIQSATIIGLFSYYVQHVNTRTSALLCVEEPELYLHPHACRVISKRLDDFAGTKNQVIVTTHSPEFIRTTKRDLNIILVRKTDEGTKAISVNVKKFKNLLLDNNYTEMFFADKVIICEGDDAYVLKFIAGEKLDEANVSVVNVSGKDNISKFVNLALSLGIKVFVLADFDYLLRDKDQEKCKFYDVPLHENVLYLTLERFSKITGSKVRSEVTKLRNKIKSEYEEKFYKSKRIEDFRDDPKAMKKIQEVLHLLRKMGIYILDGEIEDYVKEEYSDQVLTGGKFNLSSAFKVNELLNSGKRVEDIFEVEKLMELVGMVVGDKTMFIKKLIAILKRAQNTMSPTPFA